MTLGTLRDFRLLLLGGAALAAYSCPGQAWAQDATATEENDQTTVVETVDDNQQVIVDEYTGGMTALQRIVVGAGVEKVAIDTPQSVTVVDQQDLDNLQATEITDIADNVVGLNATGGTGALGQAFNIRGIGAPEVGGEEGRIIINVDGVSKFFEQYRMGGLFTDPELYKQVEVLRGPASSTLYGAGALGGVINFVTKDASDFIGEGQNTALRLKGSYETNGGDYLGQAIVAHRFNEHAEILLMGNYRNTGDYETGDGTEVEGLEVAAPNGLAKGTFTFGENMEQKLRISYQQYTGTATDQAYSQTFDQPAFGDIDERIITDKTAIIAYENVASDNPWLDLNIQFSYSDITNEQSMDGGSDLFNSTFGYESFQFNIDNTFEYIGENFENYLTIGSQTIKQERTRDGSDSGTHPEGTDFTTGFYAQNEFIWDEKLTLIAGARVDYRELTPAINDVQPFGVPDYDNWAFSPKIAALYKFNENFGVFGSIAQTQRIPTLDEVYDTIGPDPFNPQHIGLDIENSLNYEAGFAISKYDLLRAGDSFQLKTTGFYNDIQDLITDQGRTATPRYENIDEAEIYGVEVELAYTSDLFYSNAGYSLVRGNNVTTGGYLNDVAPDEFFFTIGKSMPEYGIDFGWTSRFVAAQDLVDARDPSEAFNIHDIYLNWIPQDGPMFGWEARFRVDNIFNEQYQEYLEGFPSKGRTFKVSLVKQFGW